MIPERPVQVLELFSPLRIRIKIGGVGVELLNNGLRLQRRLVAHNALQCLDQPRHCGVWTRYRAMTWFAYRRQFEPKRRLFGGANIVVEHFAVGADMDVATFIQNGPRTFKQVEVLLDHEPRAHRASCFLIRNSEKDDVCFQRGPLALQRKHGHELRDPHAFHIESPAAP